LAVAALCALCACARPGDVEMLRRDLAALSARESQWQARTDSSLVALDKEIRRVEAAEQVRSSGAEQAQGALRARIEELDQGIDDLRSGLTPIDAPDSSQIAGIEAAELYRQAYLDATRGDFELAKEGFEQLLESAPASPLRSDAQFWLGECHFAAARYQEAAESFAAALRGDSAEERLPAALLKLGLCEIELGLRGDARATLARVIDEFPTTEEARIAAQNLDQLGGATR